MSVFEVHDQGGGGHGTNSSQQNAHGFGHIMMILSNVFKKVICSFARQRNIAYSGFVPAYKISAWCSVIGIMGKITPVVVT